MKTRSSTKVKATPAVVKAARPMKKVKREAEDDLELENNKKDVTEKEQPVSTEMMKGIADRIQRIEEKIYLLISSSSSSSGVGAAVKTGSVKAEPERSSSDDEPAEKKAEEDTKTLKEESTSDDSSEESDEKEIDTRFGPVGGLFVGGPFRGGRCGGLRQCTRC
ncbi:unnamed protein product [Microthlaspi erraticum]|uniref:Uncharacterized protein n=1 Tax=Microthlaspi erraticum TaxID=1685480 RepID=A0A6D2I8A9_9BRAS|nr:unnamed protein product [Microthlaspi erraticum]